jgi:hypothetical protein
MEATCACQAAIGPAGKGRIPRDPGTGKPLPDRTRGGVPVKRQRDHLRLSSGDRTNANRRNSSQTLPQKSQRVGPAWQRANALAPCF